MAGEYKPVRRRFLAPLLMLIACAAPSPAAQADVLLAAHPEKLIIFNRYQQRLTPAELSALHPFEPLVILREKDRLGDGLTPCMSVRLGPDLYYLQIEADGRLAGAGGSAGATIIRDVRLLGDSIAVKKGEALVILSPDRGSTVQAASGSLLRRIFIHDGFTYVRHATRYGWIPPGSPGYEGWEIHQPMAREAPLSRDQLRAIVSPLVESANAVLRGLYAHRGEANGRNIQTPRFELLISGDSMTCGISPRGKVASFRESARLLGRELERIVGERGGRVSLGDDVIILSQR